MARIERSNILERLRGQVEQAIPIIGCGAGLGISAKCAEAGGADMVIVYNSGYFRTAGRGSSCGRFCFSSANEIMMDMAKEILPAVHKIPVLAGVFGSDPFVEMEYFLKKVMERGYSGIQNFPTMGMTSLEPQVLEGNGYGYDKEVEMIRTARKMDLFTAPYVFDVGQAAAMTEAGADLIVAHMGMTTKGLLGAAVANSVEACIKKVQEIADAAKEVNPEVLVIAHGGSLAEPEEVAYALSRLRHVVGFYGASSSERLPVEKKLMEAMGQFKTLTLRRC